VKPTAELDVARQRLAESVEKMEDWDTKAQSLPDDADEKEIQFVKDAFGASSRETARWQETVDRLQAIQAVRSKITTDDEPPVADDDKNHPVARGTNREPRTYSEKTSYEGRSFFVDLVNATRGDSESRTRLTKHTEEVAYEKRAISTTVTAGGNFVPPEYLGDLYAGQPRAGRPFADAIPVKLQHNAGSGMNITLPRITTGTTADVIITENSTTVSSTDIVEALLTIPVRTIAGQQDVSQQLLDHSSPGIDQVIFTDLRSAYDAKLDTYLLAGTGSSGQHLGIRAVASTNAITYTQATPTAALTVPPIYNGIQSVASNRFMPADLILMHPRRAAYLASNLSSTFPLFQLGDLYQASGTQVQGMVQNFAGLNVVLDANIATNYGAATNQDEIYVIRAQDLVLWEGDLQARVMEQTLSNTLTVRLQLYAYSAFASGRFPKSISVISGTGLVAPTF
jgi:HK97 family phage major capsid protein